MLLAEHMAADPLPSDDYVAVVSEVYERSAHDVKNRLLSAASGKQLYGKLRKRDAKTAIHASNSLFAETLIMAGPNFSAGRDINVQNLAVGDMINSANAAVQSIKGTEGAEVLERVLEFARSTSELREDDRRRIAEGAKAVAIAKSPENLNSLLAILKHVGEFGSLGNAALDQVQHLITSVGSMLS